jgi:hypothetical protein
MGSARVSKWIAVGVLLMAPVNWSAGLSDSSANEPGSQLAPGTSGIQLTLGALSLVVQLALPESPQRSAPPAPAGGDARSVR